MGLQAVIKGGARDTLKLFSAEHIASPGTKIMPQNTLAARNNITAGMTAAVKTIIKEHILQLSPSWARTW
jgi:hypothetical protein